MVESDASRSPREGGAELDYRAIFERLPTVELVLAPDPPHFTMIAATDERLAVTLTQRESVIGQPLFAVFSDANPDNPEPSGVANLRASLETVLRTRAAHRMAVQRYDLQRPDGSWEVRYWAPLNVPVLTPEGDVRYVLHHVQDITDLVLEREATAAAERREAELWAVLESMTDGVYLGSANGLALANRAALEQLGYARQSELASDLSRLGEQLAMCDAVTGVMIPSDEQPFQRALAGERVARDVVIRHRVTGEERRLRAVAIPVVVAGAVVAAAMVTTDMTEQVRARSQVEAHLASSERALADTEAARREADAANRAKSEFLRVMSHELRTPLNAIGGYTELLELGIHGPITGAQRNALDRIQRSQRHLLGLIAGLLDYSRVEAGRVNYHITDVLIADVVAEAESLVAPQLRAKGLGYAWSGAAPGMMVRADREKLQQILLNLLSNAVKFTHHRNGAAGRIEVLCSMVPADPLEPEARRVRIQVRDTGDGIAPEKLEHIFEPFVQVDQRLTRTNEGIGLGLAISRDLARGMGGDLVAESVVGVGSTLTLTLPAASIQRP